MDCCPWGLFGLLKWGNILELLWMLCSYPSFANPRVFSEVMDLLLDVVKKAVRGKYEDETPGKDYSYGFEEEGEEEELLDD